MRLSKESEEVLQVLSSRGRASRSKPCGRRSARASPPKTGPALRSRTGAARRPPSSRAATASPSGFCRTSCG